MYPFRSNGVIANRVIPVSDFRDDLDSVRTMEFVQVVGISHHEKNRRTIRAGRSFLQKKLDVANVHAGKSRRLTESKRDEKPQLVAVKLSGSSDIIDGKRGMNLLAFDQRLHWAGHGLLPKIY